MRKRSNATRKILVVAIALLLIMLNGAAIKDIVYAEEDLFIEYGVVATSILIAGFLFYTTFKPGNGSKNEIY